MPLIVVVAAVDVVSDVVASVIRDVAVVFVWPSLALLVLFVPLAMLLLLPLAIFKWMLF